MLETVGDIFHLRYHIEMLYTRHMLDPIAASVQAPTATALIHRVSHSLIQAPLLCFLGSPTLTVLHANHVTKSTQAKLYH